VLDGYSRFIVHWDFLDRMTEADIELILQRAREAHPGANPRIISDNGPQFIAGDFRRFIDLTGLTHVRTSVLPAIEREDRALPPHPRQGHHSRRHARRRPRHHRRPHRPLQQPPPPQRHRLRHPARQAPRP
jgi:transposase InsO family protein